MQTRTELTHSVDGICIPVEAEHSRPGVDIYETMILLGSLASAVGWFFDISYWGYFALPVLIGVIGYVYLKGSHQKWRDKPLGIGDIKELRSALANAQRHEIRLSPLPSCISDMTHGELEDWARTANEELQKHYRSLLSAESDAAAKQVSS